MAGAMQVERQMHQRRIGIGDDRKAGRNEARGLAHPKGRVRLRGDLIANHVDVVDEDDGAVGDLFGVAAVLDANGKRAAVGTAAKKSGVSWNWPFQHPATMSLSL